MAHGYRTELWTTQRIATLIERRLGVQVSSQSRGQTPAPVGLEPPETGTACRRTRRDSHRRMETHGLARSKKNAARLAAHIVFVDESGFLLIPTVRKTWSPVGQTPVVRHCYRHDRISAISGIAVSPKRLHCTLYCLLYEDNIQGEEVTTFLRHLLRQIRGHLIVLLDNAKIHRADPVRICSSARAVCTWCPFPRMLPN